MRRIGLLASACIVSLLTSLAPATAAASCFPPTRVRSVLPEDKATLVPTNARPRVIYTTGPEAELTCGPKPTPPVLRVLASDDGGAPGDGGAASIPGSWVLGTDDDPRASTIWEFRPAAPLSPQTTYELLDTLSESCECDKMPICPPGPLAVFARFTTGDGPDNVKPTFSGLMEGLCVRSVCHLNEVGCCGPTDHLSLRLLPALDFSDNTPWVNVHYYVRRENAAYDFSHPVGPGEINSPVDSLFVTRWDIPVPDGKWKVIARAYDLAGNEDDNMVEASFTMPLAKDPLCARVLVDGGSPPPDLTFVAPATPDGTSMDTSDLGADQYTVTGGGCSCALHGTGRRASSSAGLMALAGALAALVALRRRGRRA